MAPSLGEEVGLREQMGDNKCALCSNKQQMCRKKHRKLIMWAALGKDAIMVCTTDEEK